MSIPCSEAHDSRRSLLRAWLCSLLPPLPAVLLWHSHDGRFIALCLFFASCTSFVVYAFHVELAGKRNLPLEYPHRLWHRRMLFLALALLSQGMIFSALCLVFNDSHDVMAPILAFASLIPSFSVAPYLALETRKPVAAVVLTVFLVGCMKLLGCTVVVLVYGWNADARGYTTLTWTHPNLLVWLFWLNTALMSFLFYVLGKRKFMDILAADTVTDRKQRLNHFHSHEH